MFVGQLLHWTQNRTNREELHRVSLATLPTTATTDAIGSISRLGNTSESVENSDGTFNQIVELPIDETFSACILFMDDNPRLVEWLVYHFFALNLREVVVAVD
jgi:hypothetical protein